jgi:hypothetical protein
MVGRGVAEAVGVAEGTSVRVLVGIGEGVDAVCTTAESGVI